MNDDWKAIFDHARKKLYNKARTYEEKLDILQNGFPTGEMKGNNGHLNFRDITTSLAHKAATSIAGTGKQSAHKIPSSMGCKVINELLKRENICVKDILSVSRFFFSKDNAFPSKMNNPNQVVDGVVVEAKGNHSASEKNLESGNYTSYDVNLKGGQIKTALEHCKKLVDVGKVTQESYELVKSTIAEFGPGYKKIMEQINNGTM